MSNPLCLEPKMFVCIERIIVEETAQYSGEEMTKYRQMTTNWSKVFRGGTVDSAQY